MLLAIDSISGVAFLRQLGVSFLFSLISFVAYFRPTSLGEMEYKLSRQCASGVSKLLSIPEILARTEVNLVLHLV
jgi:hypothetical protein